MMRKFFVIGFLMLTCFCYAQEAQEVSVKVDDYRYSEKGFKLMRGEFDSPNFRKMKYDGIYSADGKVLIHFNDGTCIKPGTEIISAGSCTGNVGVLRIPTSVKYISPTAFPVGHTALLMYDDKKISKWEEEKVDL